MWSRASLISLLAFALAACSSHADELAKYRVDSRAEPKGPAAEAPPLPVAAAPATPAAPPPPQWSEVKTLDLGDVAPGAPVTFEVPAGALGFQVIVDWPSASWSGVSRIESPSGAVVLDQYTPQGGSHPLSMTVSGATAAMAAAAVPQSQASTTAPIEAGAWKVTFGGENPSGAAGAMHAKVHVQTTSDGVFHGGELDINVFIPDGLTIAHPSPAHTVSAATAAQDPDIIARIDAFFGLLKKTVDVDRGKVAFYPAPAAALSVKDNGSLDVAHAVTNPQANPRALQLTLTNALEVQGQLAWGVAPGIPGGALAMGTPLGSVILRVSVEELPNAVMGDAATVLHEGGHYFGLEHPTEFDGSTDGLTDTPSCPNIRPDAPNTDCPDVSNAMFAAGDFAADPVMSPSQRRIIQGSPTIRALLAGGAPRPLARAPAPAVDTGAVARVRLTRSGRALGATERWLAGSFCGSNRLDLAALVRAKGRDAARVDLAAIASDSDLSELLRENAARLLKRL